MEFVSQFCVLHIMNLRYRSTRQSLPILCRLIPILSSPIQQATWSYMSTTHPPSKHTPSHLSLYIFVSDMVAMAIKLTTVCSSVLENISDGTWLTQDPQGNKVILHDKERITALL